MNTYTPASCDTELVSNEPGIDKACNNKWSSWFLEFSFDSGDDLVL